MKLAELAAARRTHKAFGSQPLQRETLLELLDEPGEELQTVRRLDLPRRPTGDEDAGSRSELELLAADGRLPIALQDVDHLVALLVAVLLTRSVEAQQALLKLGNGEERSDLLAGFRGLDAVAHTASLYRCAPLPMLVKAE